MGVLASPVEGVADLLVVDLGVVVTKGQEEAVVVVTVVMKEFSVILFSIVHHTTQSTTIIDKESLAKRRFGGERESIYRKEEYENKGLISGGFPA